jgi:hypothetical protein
MTLVESSASFPCHNRAFCLFEGTSERLDSPLKLATLEMLPIYIRTSLNTTDPVPAMPLRKEDEQATGLA